MDDPARVPRPERAINHRTHQILPIECLRVRLFHRPTIHKTPGMAEFMPTCDFCGQRPDRTRRHVSPEPTAPDDRVWVESESNLRGVYQHPGIAVPGFADRKSTRLNSSH